MNGRTGRKRVLWVTDEPPDRSFRGGTIRQAYLLESLAKAFSVDLLVAGSVNDELVRSAANHVIEVPTRPAVMTSDAIVRRGLELAITLGSPYPLAAYMAGPSRRRLARVLNEIHQDYDFVCLEGEALAPLIRMPSPAKWVLELPHVLSVMIEREIELAPGRRQRWFRARDMRKAERIERAALNSYDRCIACSSDDASILEAIGGKQGNGWIGVIPNGVDLALHQASPVPDIPAVLFPGSFNYSPNVDGAVWLCNEIWPQVQEAVPAATLTLAGRAPAAEVVKLGELPGVSVHADVASMVPYMRSARVVVVPLRIGTGTRLKALEAMASGRPVVGTSVGLAGLRITAGLSAHIADTPDDFAAAITSVLTDAGSADSLGRQARAHVERFFSWEHIGDELVEELSALQD